MASPFLGQIQIFGFTFAPRGWAFCDGQLLSISQNTALFALLGTTYGGNGTTTFALPDLRGRVPIHIGQSPGLSPRSQGELGGEEAHLLTVTEMPPHRHAMRVNSGATNTTTPANNFLATGGSYSTTSDNTFLDSTSSRIAGGNARHNNMQPFLALNFSIALTGVFPSRN